MCINKEFIKVLIQLLVACLVNSDQIFKDTITVCTTKHYAEYKVQTSVEFQVFDNSVVCEIATYHSKTVRQSNCTKDMRFKFSKQYNFQRHWNEFLQKLHALQKIMQINLCLF